MQGRFPGLRLFATTRLGQVVLVAVGVILLAFASVYLGELGGILILLFSGLFLPIYLGLKRPKTLALMGVAVLILAAPLATVIVAHETLQPTGTASSFGENGGDVLQQAGVTPFNGAGGAAYTFTVTVVPRYLYANTTLTSLTLFVSTCPEASASNQTTPDCSPPYPAYQQVHRLPTNLTLPEVVSFSQRLPGPNIYWWIIYADVNYTTNGSAAAPIFLNPANGYEDIQGPVTGTFLSTLGIVLAPVYLTVILYPGVVFLIALLVYSWFKAREARRKAVSQGTMSGGPIAPPTVPGPSGSPQPSVGTPQSSDLHCPKCQAVVYANETQCWKCGAPLGPVSSPSAPLPSSKPPAPPSTP
ncbi:MAG: hypothetical protein ACYDFT_03845 [Thermoplasmata archaeon]